MIRILKQAFKLLIRLKINLLIGVLLFAGAITAPNLYFKALRGYVGPSVFLITNLGQPKGFGSGFIIENSKGRQFLATNNHVCSGLEIDGDVVALSNEAVPKVHVLKVLKKDEKNDLCITEAPAGYRGLSISLDFGIGDTVHVLGHPLGNPLHRNSGEIITSLIIPIMMGGDMFNPIIKHIQCWQLAATISPGNSGSPVVNHFGRVVGVIFAGSSENSYSAFFIGADKLHKLIEGKI